MMILLYRQFSVSYIYTKFVNKDFIMLHQPYLLAPYTHTHPSTTLAKNLLGLRFLRDESTDVSIQLRIVSPPAVRMDPSPIETLFHRRFLLFFRCTVDPNPRGVGMVGLTTGVGPAR